MSFVGQPTNFYWIFQWERLNCYTKYHGWSLCWPSGQSVAQIVFFIVLKPEKSLIYKQTKTNFDQVVS